MEILMADGTQHALSRIRPPRVQVTYDVETGGAIEKKELPFIVGVMADLAGKSHDALSPLAERKFSEIDRDNLNEVMASIKPTVALSVPNTISEEGGNVNVELTFRSMDDFSPLNVIKKVKPLKELYEARSRLNDLLAKLDGNDDLDQLLGDVVSNTERQKEMKEAVAEIQASAPAEIQASDPAEEEGDSSEGAPDEDET
jgi:type VI secretion system protein ImpB|tara:strand:- start:3313 stop:3912 length:600 start_codon:yes stop_codon:yes gene_type:complete